MTYLKSQSASINSIKTTYIIYIHLSIYLLHIHVPKIVIRLIRMCFWFLVFNLPGARTKKTQRHKVDAMFTRLGSFSSPSCSPPGGCNPFARILLSPHRCNRGKWRFSSGFASKNVIIPVAMIASWVGKSIQYMSLSNGWPFSIRK